jgi:predicted Holliday junction resolvase-like endonuclease
VSIVWIIVSVVLFIVVVALIYRLFKAGRDFEQWRAEEERRLAEARKQAIVQSRAVLGGKFTEQMAPYLPEFKYDPTEARFIGTPIDLVVFPGLAKGEPEEIVLIEVKSGRAARLTPQEKRIEELVEAGMVRWELIHRTSTEEEVNHELKSG